MRKIVFALAVAVALAASNPASAAACSRWDLSYMQLKQYNGFIVRLPAQGAGGVFNGRATLSTYGPDWVRPYSGGLAMGTYDMYGWLLLTIHWDGGGAGGYHLLIYPDGRVWGTTWNVLRGNNTSLIDGIGKARCLY